MPRGAHHSARAAGRGREFLWFDASNALLEQTKNAASAAVVVDAKDDPAKRFFYEHFEFAPFKDAPRCLFLPLTTIEKLFRAI